MIIIEGIKKGIQQNKIKHPAFAQISFSRASSNVEESLYGSSIGHKDTIMMRLYQAVFFLS